MKLQGWRQPGFVRSAPPEGWEVPWRTLIVAALERSGSNLLGEYMIQTDRLGRPIEFFSPYVVASCFPGKGETTVERCWLAAEHGRSANGVVGIKLFTQHFVALAKEIRLTEWFGEPRWIWLRRRDLLGQAISSVLARQQRSYDWRQQPSAETIYSGAAIANALEAVTRREAMWAAYFARTNASPLLVFYEDLEQAPNEIIDAIAAHAGVELPKDSMRPPQKFQRQRTALNEEWRRRFHAEMGDPDLFPPAQCEARRWPILGRLAGIARRARKALTRQGHSGR
jgi:LPS sulfotransferase NodH